MDGPVAAGAHEVAFVPGVLPGGLYLVRMEAAGAVATRPLTLVR